MLVYIYKNRITEGKATAGTIFLPNTPFTRCSQLASRLHQPSISQPWCSHSVRLLQGGRGLMWISGGGALPGLARVGVPCCRAAGTGTMAKQVVGLGTVAFLVCHLSFRTASLEDRLSIRFSPFFFQLRGKIRGETLGPVAVTFYHWSVARAHANQ